LYTVIEKSSQEKKEVATHLVVRYGVVTRASRGSFITEIFPSQQFQRITLRVSASIHACLRYIQKVFTENLTSSSPGTFVPSVNTRE
jgi:hypothetical protein